MFTGGPLRSEAWKSALNKLSEGPEGTRKGRTKCIRGGERSSLTDASSPSFVFLPSCHSVVLTFGRDLGPRRRAQLAGLDEGKVCRSLPNQAV